MIKLASAYHIPVVTPSVPAKTLSEFVALLKSQPNNRPAALVRRRISPVKCSSCKLACRRRTCRTNAARVQDAERRQAAEDETFRRREGFAFRSIDPPPLKWSGLKYVFGIKEDRNAEEASQA